MPVWAISDGGGRHCHRLEAMQMDGEGPTAVKKTTQSGMLVSGVNHRVEEITKPFQLHMNSLFCSE
jgi:hypothetical protein